MEIEYEYYKLTRDEFSITYFSLLPVELRDMLLYYYTPNHLNFQHDYIIISNIFAYPIILKPVFIYIKSTDARNNINFYKIDVEYVRANRTKFINILFSKIYCHYISADTYIYKWNNRIGIRKEILSSTTELTLMFLNYDIIKTLIRLDKLINYE